MVPEGTRRCIERYGERHQQYPALNHMCNQSKLMARRQVWVKSRPGSLKAREVQPASRSLGNHGFIYNLGRSPSGNRAASNAMGNEMSTPPDLQIPA